jgi:hypothetical protein
VSGGSDYEAVRLLAHALHERDYGGRERAVELLDEAIRHCDGRDTPTCHYVSRTAYVALYGIHRAAGREEAASRCRKEALKFGATDDELNTGVR